MGGVETELIGGVIECRAHPLPTSSDLLSSSCPPLAYQWRGGTPPSSAQARSPVPHPLTLPFSKTLRHLLHLLTGVYSRVDQDQSLLRIPGPLALPPDDALCGCATCADAPPGCANGGTPSVPPLLAQLLPDLSLTLSPPPLAHLCQTFLRCCPPPLPTWVPTLPLPPAMPTYRCSAGEDLQGCCQEELKGTAGRMHGGAKGWLAGRLAGRQEEGGLP